MIDIGKQRAKEFKDDKVMCNVPVSVCVLVSWALMRMFGLVRLDIVSVLARP